MQNRYKSLIKNTGYLTASNFASRVLVFLLVPLYTGVLSTEEYGSFDVIVTTVQLMSHLLIANMSDGVMRFLLDRTYDKGQTIRVGLKYVFIGISASGIIIAVLRILSPIPILEGLELYAFLYAAFFILNNFFIQYAKGMNKVSIIATAGVISTIVMVSGNIVLLFVYKMGLEGFFTANILSLAFSVLYYAVRLKPWREISGSRIPPTVEKEMLLYSMPLMFNTIGWARWCKVTVEFLKRRKHAS